MENQEKYQTNPVGEFIKITEEMAVLFEKKNKAYDNSFSDTYQKYGLVGVVPRMYDKHKRLGNLALNRLRNLILRQELGDLSHNQEIDDLGESIEDTLIDIANYCVMTLMEIRKENGE